MKIRSKLIKPHTPTPPHLKNYKISFADKHQRPVNLAVVLFYESEPESDRQLEESLAKTLVQFFPLAGRFIKEQNSIDCSDQGIEFVEAEALAVDLLSRVGTEQHNDLLPDHFFQIHESVTQPLLSVQSTRFARGGMAIAISVSHRVFDVSSLGMFITAWSSATNPDKTVVRMMDTVTPSFGLPSLLPSKEHDFVTVSSKTTNTDTVVRKLLFDKATLTTLKSKIGKPVSGARMVCAVIAKALIRLDGAKHGGRSRAFRIFQPVNMRGRTITPIPKHACGNFSFVSVSRRMGASEAEGIGIPELVDLIGESVRRGIEDYAEIVSLDRDGRDIIINTLEKLDEAFRDRETNVIVFTDWSKFGFYEADFGWGKPMWTSTGPKQTRSNATVLMSNKEGDGIEAWVYLNKSIMGGFDQDGEFMNQIIYNFS